MQKDIIFISAGELSGDIHAGKLIHELHKIRPNLAITAIGGDNMAAAGAEILLHIRETSFMGFAEVVKHFPKIHRTWRNTLAWIDRHKPNLVILIDYPGFNLRLAAACHKRGIPVVYYITPQVWAWHQSRVEKIKKYIQEVLCILPFEESWFREKGVVATYVGHPLLDLDRNSTTESKTPEGRQGSTFIGLFPGSRMQEVERHLEVMVDAVKMIRENIPDIGAVVAMARNLNLQAFREKYPHEWLHWHEGRNQAIMQDAALLIMSSGTASLEATIANAPTIIIYRLSRISYWIGKRLINVPFIAIPNLIAGQKGLPELIQDEAEAPRIAEEARALLLNPGKVAQMKSFMRTVVARLGDPGASQRAAEKIIKYLPSFNNSETQSP